MGLADNSHVLAEAAARRHEQTLRRAQTAIEHLDRTGQPITFRLVSATAGVSRTWLYNHPDMRRTIMSLRSAQHSGPAVTPAAQRASGDSLR